MRRENGWPSVEHDLLHLADFAHRLLPVGFYYKTFLRPSWLWPRAEPLLRRAAGLGTADFAARPEPGGVRHRHVDVLVVGAGVAGLAAAIAAAESGASVLICDEGRIGEQIAPGPARDIVVQLAAETAGLSAVTVLECAPAVGIYEGPLVPVNAAGRLEIIHPARVVVATGAVEQHAVFPGNDLPGVFQARGAARLAGCHGLLPGRVAVAAIDTVEGCAHLLTLVEAGMSVVAALVPEHLRPLVPEGVRAIVSGRLVRVEGRSRGRVRAAVVETSGRREHVRCDVVVLARGFQPRDGLLRQAEGLAAVGAGDVVDPGCTVQAAVESGRRAGRSGSTPSPRASISVEAPQGGFICLCEDVSAGDLDLAWHEGFRSTELLKRYTTVGMGPCQGALCQAHLAAFAAARLGAESYATARTTARPPVRPITVQQVSAGARDLVEQRTRLDDRHLSLGATMEPAGAWRRPSHYGDVDAEYRAVRHAVGVMDVGTLGKFLVAGADATAFLERLYPCRVADLAAGRIRYALLLAETGFVVDDGLICAIDGSSWYLTFTSGGADHAEAWLHDWIDTWGMDVHVVNLTAGLGAINVAGPLARDLLQALSPTPLDNESFAYLRHREIEVAGIPCRAVRLGFVGELSYELHHPSARSVELWDALAETGTDFGIRAHGLEALRLLRLEKGHIIVGQDTDYDSTPARLGMSWAVKMDKRAFVGKVALERMSQRIPSRRLAAMRFEGGAPPEGATLIDKGEYAGYLTSSRHSPTLGCGVALGWITSRDGSFPEAVESNGLRGIVVDQPFYDPQGHRLRA